MGCLALLDLRSSLLRLAAGLRPLRRIPLEMPGSPENLPAAAVEPPRRSGFALGGFRRFSGVLALRYSNARRFAAPRFVTSSKVVIITI